jgi:FixJ family two-component response regulator
MDANRRNRGRLGVVTERSISGRKVGLRGGSAGNGWWPVFCQGAQRSLRLMRCKRDGSACLVLDLSMPGMSGLDVQQWLLDSGDPLPTLFLTGQYEIPEELWRHMERSAGILRKPVAASILVKAIEEALKSNGDKETGIRSQRSDVRNQTG